MGLSHKMAKSFVGHPYAGWLTKDEKIVVTDMTKSMVKPRNILLTFKSAMPIVIQQLNKFKMPEMLIVLP